MELSYSDFLWLRVRISALERSNGVVPLYFMSQLWRARSLRMRGYISFDIKYDASLSTLVNVELTEKGRAVIAAYLLQENNS